MSISRVNVGNILLLVSLMPLAFLLYTLLNLSALQIPITHPRVIVELSLFLIFILAGAYFRYYYPGR